MQTKDKNYAIIQEIKAQIIQIDVKLPKEENVSKYVKLLAEKRQLVELQKQQENGI